MKSQFVTSRFLSVEVFNHKSNLVITAKAGVHDPIWLDKDELLEKAIELINKK